MTKTFTGLYDSYEDAAQTVRELETAGIPHDDISIVSNRGDDEDDAGNHAGTGAATGAGIGAVVGGGAGLLAGIGALAIPGVGPVVAAGWLVATLAGVGAGAAGGGIVGSLTGAGISKEHAHVYAEGVRRGGTLVTVRADESRAAVIEPILQRNRLVDAEARRTAYAQEGWVEFDAGADPYVPTAPLTGMRDPAARL